MVKTVRQGMKKRKNTEIPYSFYIRYRYSLIRVLLAEAESDLHVTYCTLPQILYPIQFMNYPYSIP